MSEQGETFDAAVVFYEASLKRVLDLVDEPCKDQTVAEYREHLQDALKAQQRAHKAMMAAWAT